MKTTKKSALLSVMALFLCLTMLLGTTWAWFTDSVTSSGNKIQAGTLKLDLEMLNKETGAYESIKTSKDPIFNYNLWEPGYTDVKFLKVENEGSLSLKWKAMFVSDEEVSKLAEVIDVYVLPSVTELGYDNLTRDFDGWRRVGTLDQFINTLSETTYGNLLPYSCAYLGIALHMQESAGNEYQEIGLEAFDIQIVATQMSNEEDSFGPDYDNDAEWPAGEMSFRVPFTFDDVATINGELAEDKIVVDPVSGAYAIIPAGAKIVEGVEPYFSGNGIGNSGTFSDEIRSYDIHIEGIAPDNTKPITVFIGKILPAGLGETELKFYHEDVQMTRVNSVEDFAINNQFTYDAETGAVVLYVTNFSVFSGVKTSADEWDGTYDISWYNSNTTTFTLNTAEQFAGFRAIVDGGYYTVVDGVWTWNETVQDNFDGKTVKLGKDINLMNILFDPIGKGYAHNGGQVFMGTFDGDRYTIYGLKQNGWDLDPNPGVYDTYTYSTSGGGLFASVKDATIKNLAISGAEIVFECVDMGILVGYAQGECHFENIVVTKSTIANYNRYTGGLVGEVCKGVDNNGDGFTHTFKNIVVDSSVVVSSLWGSFDTSIGGVIGGKWGDAKVHMDTVTVAAELDVFSDVTAAYQWYAYRRCGMLIGHTEQNSPKSALNADAPFLTCENVVVYYGDWVNYTYYQFADQKDADGNSLWYSNYPWVRAEAGKNNGAFSNPRYGNPIVNGVAINTVEAAEELNTPCVKIKFDQLYGGGQGVYGKADHDGVDTVEKNSTKIYFQNNWNWTNLKLYYWFENGEDRWTTVVDGVSVNNMAPEKVGGYDVYTFEMPAYVAGFKVEGYDTTTKTTHSTEEVSAEHIIENNIYWFVHSAGNYGIATNAYNNNANFQTHDIYVVGSMNDWSTSNLDSKYHFTTYSNGKWTLNVTFDVTTQIKLYNKLVVSDGYAGWINKDDTTENVELAPGKYTITYDTSKNTFTFTMTERILYLKPSTDWSKDGARFAAYVWYFSGSTKNEKWYSMTKMNDGTYKVSIPAEYENVIFCRMNGSATADNWNNKWNQTGDLKTGDGSLFTIKQGTWDNQTSGWSKK